MKGIRVASLLAAAVLAAGLSISMKAEAGLLDKVIEGAPKRVDLTPSSDMPAAYKEAFTPSGMFGAPPDPANGAIRKVVVAGFQVEFATEQKGILKGEGSGAGLLSTTDVVYALKGVQASQTQAITDKLYEAFLAQLRQRGYEVLPVSVLAETAYKDSLTKANQPPVVHERGVALDLVMTPSEKEVSNASLIASAQNTPPDVFSQTFASMGPGPRAADSLQAYVLHVRMKLNFSRFEETGWFMPDLDSQPQNVLSPNGTFVQLFAPGGQYKNYPLMNSVILPHRLADQAVPVSASSGETAMRAAGGVSRVLGGALTGNLGGMIGGATGSVHSVMASGNYEVTAGGDYESLMTQDGSLGLTLLSEVMAKAKAE